MLEKMFPEESKKLRCQIEKEYQERYAVLEYMAQATPEQLGCAVPASGTSGSETNTESDSCEIADTPEHARPGTGDACDDGRSGK